MSLPIGLQLFSVRDESEKDFIGTLRKVAEIGYDAVEFAGYGGLKSSELKAVLEELGLKVCGSHISLEELTNNLDYMIEYNKELGNSYIICPFTNPKSKEECIDIAAKLNIIGEKCKANGLICGYHNHSHEFKQIDGEYILDILYKETDPELVKSELDTYWAQNAGLDPIEYIHKHSGRIDLVHIKDMETFDGEKRSTEVGNGIMDIKGIIDDAEKQGAKWLVVEQEYFTKPTIECVKVGYENLARIVKGE